jgi:TolA-binding protein
MKDTRPLVTETDSDEVRALLRSAELDNPPSGAMRRVLTRAGVGMGILAAATSTSVSSAAKIGPMVVGKWLAVAAVVGAGSMAAVHVTRLSTPKVASQTALTKTAQEAVSPPPVAPVAESPVAAEPPVAEAPVAGSPRSKAPPTPGSADITGEIAAISVARSALDKGNARAGLSALDHYQQDYPHGALAPEATVLRIEALLMAGDRARAKSLGESFLKAHPKSPHAQRVRSLIGPATP